MGMEMSTLRTLITRYVSEFCLFSVFVYSACQVAYSAVRTTKLSSISHDKQAPKRLLIQIKFPSAEGGGNELAGKDLEIDSVLFFLSAT